MASTWPRFMVSTSAGIRDGKRFAVIDCQERDDHGGTRRVSFHRTFKQAQAEAKRRNRGVKGTDEPV